MEAVRETIAELRSACVRYGAVTALDGLDLALGRGEILGFLGTNGAGKTTTIKLLLGLIRPNAGEVAVFGRNPSDPAARVRIGYMSETASYYPYLTPRELLAFYGGLSGLDRALIRRRTDVLLERLDLGAAARRRLGTFSKGMLQRVGIAQALIAEPELLILDEPFTGLDPLARTQLRKLMKNLRDEGKTIFFSSHELGEAELLCDRVAVMKSGRCRFCGSVKDLAGDGDCNLERLFLKVLAADDPQEAVR